MRADGLNSMLVKEHDFRFTIGAETHLFVVEELVAILQANTRMLQKVIPELGK